MVPKRVACVVTVSRLIKDVDEKFVEKDDGWPAEDEFKFEKKGVARAFVGETDAGID